MTNALGETLTMEYDGLRRLSKTTGGAFNRAYSYRDISSTQTTMQVSQLSYPNLGSGVSFGYTYDTLGNIATYTAPDGEKITYTYDAQGQLLKAVGNETYTYTYDSVGNILTANGHTYTYGNANWKDLLTAFDGHTITYDQSGNPIGYYNGTTWAFTWSNGRSLTRAVSTTQALDFTYDSSGLRTSKTVDGVTHKYLYAGGKLMRETYGSNTLDFFYDANGTPYALKYNGTVYYYITNLQGDVIQIVDASGNAVATYEYDPYGKVISATGTLAETNPIRYRGYYYDGETRFYYLHSRYYDPESSRFISPDEHTYTGQGLVGNNMFAYCGNNPIARVDAEGDFWLSVGIGVAVAAITGLANGYSSYSSGGDFWPAFWIGVGTGGLGYAASLLCPSELAAVGIRMISSVASNLLTTATNSGNITPQDWVAGTCDAIMDGLFSTIAYFYNPFSTDFVKTTFNAIVDGLTDIAENWLFNSTTPETAQSSFVPSSTLRRPIRTKRSQHSAFEQICLLY